MQPEFTRLATDSRACCGIPEAPAKGLIQNLRAGQDGGGEGWGKRQRWKPWSWLTQAPP